MKYRWFWLVCVVLALWFCRMGMQSVHAQITTANTPGILPVAATATSANCATQAVPIAGTTWWCFGGDGKAMVSVSGAAYVPWPPASTAPITGITVGGVAQTPTNGIVALPKIPTTATGTVTLGVQ